jgi:hypothetical protein
VVPTCTFLNATTDGTLPPSCGLPTDNSDDSDSSTPYDDYGYGYGYGYPSPPNSTTNATTPVSRPSGMPIPKPTGWSTVLVNATMNGTSWSGIKPMTYEGGAAAASRSVGVVVFVGALVGMVSL